MAARAVHLRLLLQLARLLRHRSIIGAGDSQWKDAGGILAKVLDDRPNLKTKLPALVNDCLLALSARSLGASLYTRNRDDFILLQSVRSFSLVVIK